MDASYLGVDCGPTEETSEILEFCLQVACSLKFISVTRNLYSRLHRPSVISNERCK